MLEDRKDINTNKSEFINKKCPPVSIGKSDCYMNPPTE